MSRRPSKDKAASAMGRMSARKGSIWERQIGVLLSLWLTRGHRADLFARTVLSGGRFTMQSAKGGETNIPGDLMAQHPAAFKLLQHFMIEAKHNKNINLGYYLLDHRQQSFLAKTVDLAMRQATAAGLSPMVIAKQNNRQAVMLISVPTLRASIAASYHGIVPYHLLHQESIAMVPFQEFRDLVDPDKFIAAYTSVEPSPVSSIDSVTNKLRRRAVG